MKHVLSAPQFSKEELFEILNRAKEMEKIIESGASDLAKGKILATLFYEPSTRTRLSFETAMHRLGGSVITVSDTKSSSVSKGETIEDTIKVISGYADVIAMRSSEIGYAERASKVSRVSILNAGDGAGEHPTQALLDLFTISKYFKLDEEPIHVVFVGDLKYGRTVHSLERVLRNFKNVKISYVAPKSLQIPESHRHPEDETYTELTDEILKSADVLYDTRVQEERFSDRDEYLRLRDIFILTKEKVQKMKDRAILLHPLPRVNEIHPDVDALPQAKYFEQARNGVPVRMALIARGLGI